MSLSPQFTQLQLFRMLKLIGKEKKPYLSLYLSLSFIYLSNFLLLFSFFSFIAPQTTNSKFILSE